MRGKLIILSLILLSGCATQQRCFEKFPPDTITTTTIEYRDSIIPVYISNTDTVFRWGTIIDTIFAESGTAHGRTWVIHDTLRLEVWQSDSIYQVQKDSLIQVIKTHETEIVTIKEKAEFVVYLKWGFASLVLILLIMIFKK